MTFDMNRTWSQGLALLKANFSLLSVIAGVFLLLPGALFYVALPEVTAALATTQDPNQMLAILQAHSGKLIGFGLVATIAQLIGYLGMIALMGGDRPTVGEALKRAFAGLPTAIGATMLLVLVYAVVGLVLSVLLGGLAAGAGAIGGAGLAAVLVFIGVAAIMVAVLYIVTRFTLTTPTIVLDGLGNPVAAMKRSWELTRSHAMKIFGFFALLFIAYLVIAMLLGGVVGVIAALFGGGAVSALINGLFNGVLGAGVAMLFSAILTSMHQQLAGGGNQGIGMTFG
jgi:membrane-anchored glycerophosphoryl diester phosphodiesterase (GDPDase)